jgi:hypothetical protein
MSFRDHSERFWINATPKIPVNKRREKINRSAPAPKLPDAGSKYGKKKPKVVGMSRTLWAMSDKNPAARIVNFLEKDCDMLCKRIAQNKLFFYHCYVHDKTALFKLLLALNVRERI